MALEEAFILNPSPLPFPSTVPPYPVNADYPWLLTWPLHVTSSSSTQLTELSQLNTSSEFLQKLNFSERQETKVSSLEIPLDFFHSRWAPPLIHLVYLLLGWPFYIEELKKNGLFANLKKCYFYKDNVRFLGYVVSAQRI